MRWMPLAGAYLLGCLTMYLIAIVREISGYEVGNCSVCGLPSWDEHCMENHPPRPH